MVQAYHQVTQESKARQVPRGWRPTLGVGRSLALLTEASTHNWSKMCSRKLIATGRPAICIASAISTSPSVGIKKAFSTGFAPPWDSEHRQFGADSKPGELGWAASLESYLHSTPSAGQHPERLFSWLGERGCERLGDWDGCRYIDSQRLDYHLWSASAKRCERSYHN